MPELSREFITKEICQKVKGDFPPNGLKVGLYDPNTKQIQTQTQKKLPTQWSQGAALPDGQSGLRRGRRHKQMDGPGQNT